MKSALKYLPQFHEPWGLKRIKITSLEKREGIWYGKYQILPEKELDEKSLDELTEKFVRHFPDIIEKSKLGSVESTKCWNIAVEYAAHSHLDRKAY